MLKIGLSLFLTGLFLGAGPCLISCGPFLVSFIAGNKKSFKESLWICLVFSLTRLFAYLVLGVIAGLFSQTVISGIYEKGLARWLFIGAGVFVSVIGLLMIIGKYPQIKICQVLKKSLLSKDTKSIAIFGLIIGFLPCAPLLGILAYVALISKSIARAVFYCFSFGVGTLISPLILMALCASAIAKLVGSQERVFSIFQKICGVIILFLGLQLFRNGLIF